jgi:hypothetical protein
MQAWVGITDGDWYRFLASRPDLDEVKLWQPGGTREFRRLSVGQPFLFKLHAPDNFIVGGGFFRYNTLLPATAAWEAFGDKNGAATFDEMRRRIERYRRVPPDPHADYTIGCILLQAPFFFDRQDWIPALETSIRSEASSIRRETKCFLPGAPYWSRATAIGSPPCSWLRRSDWIRTHKGLPSSTAAGNRESSWWYVSALR